MRISYAIPVCNEIDEIQNLTEYLLKHKSEKDEIVILVDETNHTQEVKDYIDSDAKGRFVYDASPKSSDVDIVFSDVEFPNATLIDDEYLFNMTA